MAYIFYSCIQFSVLVGHPPPSQLKGNVSLQSYTPQLLRPGRNFCKAFVSFGHWVQNLIMILSLFAKKFYYDNQCGQVGGSLKI